MTLTTVGHTDQIEHGTIGELVYATALCMVATVVYAYTLAELTSLLVGQDAKIERYRRQLAAVERYLSSRRIDTDTRALVRDHFRAAYENEHENDEAVLSLMPRTLRTRVLRSANKRLLYAACFSQGVDDQALDALAAMMNRAIYMPDESIIEYGSVPMEMYILEEGRVLLEFEPSNNRAYNEDQMLGRAGGLVSEASTSEPGDDESSVLREADETPSKVNDFESEDGQMSNAARPSEPAGAAAVKGPPSESNMKGRLRRFVSGADLHAQSAAEPPRAHGAEAPRELSRESSFQKTVRTASSLSAVVSMLSASKASKAKAAGKRKRHLGKSRAAVVLDLPGTALCESAFVFGVRSPYSAIAHVRTTLLSIKRSDFLAVTMEHKTAGAQLRKNLLNQLTVSKDDRQFLAKVEAMNRMKEENTVTEMCYAAGSGDVERLLLLAKEIPVSTGAASRARSLAPASTHVARCRRLAAGSPTSPRPPSAQSRYDGRSPSARTADYDGRCALHVAASEGHLAAVEALLSLGASINATDRWGHTALRDALANRHMELALSLHRHKARLLMSDVELASALCEMAKAAELEMLKCYLLCGADASVADYDGRTAMHIACSEGLRPIVEVLLDHISDPSPVDRFGNTPLCDAIRHGHHELATHLYSLDFKLNLEASRLAAKLCQAAYAGELERLRTYATCGADLNAADYDMRTAMHIAASEGCTRIVELLLSFGADANPIDRFGNTPLQDCLRHGHETTATFLRSLGANTAAELMTPAAKRKSSLSFTYAETPIGTMLGDVQLQCKWTAAEARTVAAGISRWDSMMKNANDMRGMDKEAWTSLTAFLIQDRAVGPRLWGHRREGIVRELALKIRQPVPSPSPPSANANPLSPMARAGAQTILSA
jgi:ankyrin repeat protein/CRP-like cAMP-binding protein